MSATRLEGVRMRPLSVMIQGEPVPPRSAKNASAKAARRLDTSCGSTPFAVMSQSGQMVRSAGRSRSTAEMPMLLSSPSGHHPAANASSTPRATLVVGMLRDPEHPLAIWNRHPLPGFDRKPPNS